MQNRVELKEYIRFQLSQLSSRNGEHEFENLCFELARLRQASNLLPATGPVQAGGDQGRDFESYRTHLAGSPIGHSAFVARVSNKTLVGACTLSKNIESKIMEDLKVIFSFDPTPDGILYYAEPDIPVAKRHKIQDQCRILYDADLNIFDGAAISDQLADPDTFWIAVQYLAVPADFFPYEPQDDEYDELREKWLQQHASPENYADFLDIKRGLRAATFESRHRHDLSRWITRMDQFTSQEVPKPLRQKARYEIAVAELRGKGSLDPAKEHIADFFSRLTEESPIAEMLDASVLVTYCWGALGHQATTIPEQQINSWQNQIDQILDSTLSIVDRRGDRCTLLEAKAVISSVPQEGEPPQSTIQRSLKSWRELVAQARIVPFFPVSHIADLVELLVPLAGRQPEFRSLRDEIDDLVSQRAGPRELAERSRRRAAEHLRSGNRLAAIDELQRVKVGWFAGETLDGSVIAMLLLSTCYSELGLHIAARYYAAGASYVALHSDAESVERKLPHAVLALLDTFYRAGEGVTFLKSLNTALTVHYSLETDPDDLDKHPELARALTHAAIFRVVSMQLAPHIADAVERIAQSWLLDKSVRDELLSMPFRDGMPWESLSNAELEDRISQDLGNNPFSDLGPTREVTWSALGILWNVRFNSDRHTVIMAFELISTLQIAQVELADKELLIVPNKVILEIEAGQIERAQIEQIPDNEQMRWRVILQENEDDIDTLATNTLALASAVIGQTTALRQDQFYSVLDECMRNGLPLRAFSVRPARELMDFALSQVDEWDELAQLEPPQIDQRIEPVEPPELEWRRGPGPGYSWDTAQEYLQNRYRRSLKVIRLSLPRILQNRRARAMIYKLREEGLLDWQILSILANMVAQYQVEKRLGRPMSRSVIQPFLDRFGREEREDDPPFDVELINKENLDMQKITMLASAFKTWGLTSNSSTPNYMGMKRLLDERYNHSSDDIPHDDPFGSVSPR